MPLVKPFRGLLYADSRRESMATVLAPPFDMVSGEEQQALFARSIHNIAWLTVADDCPGYPCVAERLARWRDKGIFVRDAEPALYVYEQQHGPHRLRGFLGAVRLGDPQTSGVYPHENTFPEPIMDRLTLMKSAHYSLEPVFGLYADDSGRVERSLHEATASEPVWTTETTDGAQHGLWRLTDPAPQRTLSDILASQRVVIADGHHRWAAANAYHEQALQAGDAEPEAAHGHALMLLTEARTGGVTCGAFHRVVQRLPDDVDPSALPRHLGDGFTVLPFVTQRLSDHMAARLLVERIREAGAQRPTFGCAWPGGAAVVRIDDLESLLKASGAALDPIVREFDVALLHELVLKPRLGCRGDFSDQACAITFEKDPVVAWRRAAAGQAAMAWFVNPTPTEVVMRAAFAGLKVPQKATHFHPKPPSGMVMYDLGTA